MPQLNPLVWFHILVFAWTVLLTLMPNKVLNHLQQNDFKMFKTKPYNQPSWNWPW
uniref:ATP synthase complex subunit 8 n=1 Tax=Amblypharyngodon mola TaxID=857615 RepID=A0A4Y6GIE0_9TELE|nr:ATP synthase F0 subunit 8 [Amblypharyngodon mola]QDF42870.1 ATP synthase F0 subunit 6 [Amblypharyngodon mola]